MELPFHKDSHSTRKIKVLLASNLCNGEAIFFFGACDRVDQSLEFGLHVILF